MSDTYDWLDDDDENDDDYEPEDEDDFIYSPLDPMDVDDGEGLDPVEAEYIWMSSGMDEDYDFR